MKKITAFQLDRLFRSLASKDEDETESETEPEDEDTSASTKVNVNDEPVLEQSEMESMDTGVKVNKEPKASGNANPKKHKSQLILNKIHELNNKKTDKLLWIPHSKALEGGLDEGKVKQLTRFFDTQEYFNQRVREAEA